ncbi:hypothetical protein [Pannonibacter sp.]|uniref:hypothetical protein n=1 Tax=Pannonibacter sp. TaxID=1906786 RepID=UPI003F701541
MFISIVFPVADFRSLHPQLAGRLWKPRWGEHDPQAHFARGFGSIQTRTKSGVGFVGENYYADCENLVRYPAQTFVSPLVDKKRPILSYPIYRRFYFDGQMSGRFEFGFRLNEASIDEIAMMANVKKTEVHYDPIVVVKELLSKAVDVHVPDTRRLHLDFKKISNALRDSYLLSSTKNDSLNKYDIESVGSNYVDVGRPFVFLRSGKETPTLTVRDKRSLLSEDFEMFGARSGVQGRRIDTVILQSPSSTKHETDKERLARLTYTQLRALSSAHSFYVQQVDRKKLTGASPLEPAIASMLERLQNLAPLDDDTYDASICKAMSEIVKNSDIDPSRLAEEIKNRFRPRWYRKLVPGFLQFLDKKADVAIEAAASTATKHALTGGL